MEERMLNGIGYITAHWPLDPARATIVFIHGAGGTGNFWQAQVEGLAERANTLAIDLPGHGRSEGDGEDTIEGYARSVIDFMKWIDVPNPIPCGLSMGGAITLQLLFDCPKLLRAGVLLSTGARLKVAPMIFEALETDYNGYLTMFCEIIASPKTDSEIIRRWRENTARCKPEVTLRDFKACNRFDVMQLLGSIQLPVLVVSAEDDQLTPTKYGEYLKNNLPMARGTHFMEAGHILPMEKPEQFIQAIEKFLGLEGL